MEIKGQSHQKSYIAHVAFHLLNQIVSTASRPSGYPGSIKTYISHMLQIWKQQFHKVRPAVHLGQGDLHMSYPGRSAWYPHYMDKMLRGGFCPALKTF